MRMVRKQRHYLYTPSQLCTKLSLVENISAILFDEDYLVVKLKLNYFFPNTKSLI